MCAGENNAVVRLENGVDMEVGFAALTVYDHG